MKLEQASVAQQKHHSWMAARTIFSAMKILQDADCLKESEKKKNSKKKERFFFLNCCIRLSISIHLVGNNYK